MKILLIFPPRRSDSYIFPPTSLLYISQAVRLAGHEAEIVDIPYLLERYPERYSLLDNSVIDHIINKDCDILGLGGVVSTYFFYDYFVNKYREAKKHIPIVVGGSVGFPIKEVWAQHAPVDYLVEGDGEAIIQKLMSAIQDGDYKATKNIPGLYSLVDGAYEGVKARDIIPLDEFPFLDYDELDTDYYIDELSKWIADILPDRKLIDADRIRALPLLTSRGCPFKCTFCFHFNNKYFGHSVDYVVENIKLLNKKYDINVFYIIDDLFIFDEKRTIELCERIYREELGVYFVGSGGKPSLITANMLDAMRKAGFVRFSYGIESGSQKMLDSMQKKTTVQQNFDALRMTDEKGIPSYANIIIGMPGEDCATIKETKQFLISADLNTKRFYPSWAVAYPGTPLFDWMKENEMVKDTYEYLFEVRSIGFYNYNFSELSMDSLKKEVYLLRQQVDMAYYWKRKEYRQYLMKMFAMCVGQIYFSINERVRESIRDAIRKFLPKEGKRTVKRSSSDIEKWAESLRSSDGRAWR